jgi:type IV secretory pathway VirB10-like protein
MMPEEKYGDIDVNPIEAHLNPQDKTTTEIKETEMVEKIEENPAKTQLNSKDEATEDVTGETEVKEEVEIADHQDQDQNLDEKQDQDENQDQSQNQIEATAEASADNQPKLLAAKDTPLLLDTKVEDVPSADSQSTTNTPKMQENVIHWRMYIDRRKVN